MKKPANILIGMFTLVIILSGSTPNDPIKKAGLENYRSLIQCASKLPAKTKKIVDSFIAKDIAINMRLCYCADIADTVSSNP